MVDGEAGVVGHGRGERGVEGHGIGGGLVGAHRLLHAAEPGLGTDADLVTAREWGRNEENKTKYSR